MVGTWSSRGGEARNASPELEHFLESQWESRVSDSPALAPPRPSPLKFPQASGAAGAWLRVPCRSALARAGGTLAGLRCGA